MAAPVPVTYTPIPPASESTTDTPSLTTYTTTTTDSLGSPTLDITTLITTTAPSDYASSPVPTTTPNYWGWNCNMTNTSRVQLSASQSGWGCSETFVLPSSTQISMNLTEPSETGTGGSEPTRTFVPGDFPGAASRVMDTGIGGMMGLVVVVGVWVGLI